MTILATLCYLTEGDQVLMLHRNKRPEDYHKGKYNGLGGKLLSGETPEACVVREVFEESGLKLTHFELRGTLTFPLFDGENDWYCYVYRGLHWEGTLKEGPEGSLQWIPLTQLMDLLLWPGDRKFLPLVFETGSWFSGAFYYQAGNLKSYELYRYPTIL